jgi:hypothetical protein
VQIAEYEEKYRVGLLVEHLDKEAQTKIIGVEDDYKAAMVRIASFFGNPSKVIQSCLAEIQAHLSVSLFDYRAMVSYKNCLSNNYARLRARVLSMRCRTQPLCNSF